MTPLKKLTGNRGFTLVELLVTMVLFSIVVAAIYGVFTSMQRSSDVQESYADMEQNLRIGLDSIARDIRIAGYLVPGADAAFSSATSTSFSLRTLSSPGFSARVMANVTLANNPGIAQAVTLENPHPFAIGDYVRIIRPRDLQLPIKRVLKVDSTTASSVDLLLVNTDFELLRGDMLTNYRDPNLDADDDPNTFSGTSTVSDSAEISYALVGKELTRTSGVASVVAEDISSVAFLYLMEDGTSTSSPAASNFDNIIGIEVTLNGEVTTIEGNKTRTLISRILRRNI